MATLTEVLPAQTASPHNAMTFTPGRTPATGLLTVHTHRASVTYGVAAFATDFDGRAFRLAKCDGEPGTDAECDGYDVFCGRFPADDRCECRGFLRWGRPCKHIAACRALIDNRWL